MTWLTWRLQRAELLVMGLIALVIGAALVQSHADVVATSKFYTAETCPVPLTGTERGCIIPVGPVYQIVMQWLTWFNVLPLVAAVLLALPIVVELENGSYRLAWTQGITRTHWARVKLGVLILSGVLFAAIFTLTFTWWSSPRDFSSGKLGNDYYDLRGTLPIGYTLFAIGLVLAIGIAARRPILAIIGSALVYLAVQIPTAIWLRPHLVAPVTQSDTEYFATKPRNIWFLSSWWQDATDKRYSGSQFVKLCDLMSGVPSRTSQDQCVAEHGLVHYQTYHPESHYWPLQLTETGLFVVAGLVLIGFAAWYLVRRVE